jgi:hypothetical protein
VGVFQGIRPESVTLVPGQGVTHVAGSYPDDVPAYIVESLTHRWPAGGGGGTIRSELAMRIGNSQNPGEIYWGHIDVYEDLGLDDLARVFERWWIDVMHQAVPARN